MKDKIDKIRATLDEIEQALPGDDGEHVLREFTAFELPQIIKDVVDYLMPSLTPYQAAFYWHMFRHSVLQRGDQYVRISTRSFMAGVVKSPYIAQGGSNPEAIISLGKVRDTLSELERANAIRKEGEPNREGTLYKVLIPEEIEACREAMRLHQASDGKSVDVLKEVDFYNVRENRHRILERDEYRCRYCGKQLTRFTATLDHMRPVSAGGDNSFENVITACLGCNSKKTGKLLADFLADQDMRK